MEFDLTWLRRTPWVWLVVGLGLIFLLRFALPSVWVQWYPRWPEWCRVILAAWLLGCPLALIGIVRRGRLMWATLNAMIFYGPIIGLALWGRAAVPSWWFPNLDRNWQLALAWGAVFALNCIGVSVMAKEVARNAARGDAFIIEDV